MPNSYQDPFANLASEEDPSARWKRIGASERKRLKVPNIKPMDAPEPKSSMPKKAQYTDPFAHLEAEPASPANREGIFAFNKRQPGTDVFGEKMPTLREGMKEASGALGQSAKTYPRGLKQMWLERFGKPGEAEAYTKNIDLLNKKYEASPEAQSTRSKVIRGMVEQAPYAATSVIAPEGLLARMAYGGATGGALSGGEYVPEGDSRLFNTLSGAVGGAATGSLPRETGKEKKLQENIKTLFAKNPEPQEWVNNIRSAHDVQDKQASDIYNLVKERVYPEGVGTIDIDKSVIDKARDFFPKSKKYDALIEKANSGDYEALHQLQSDLGKEGFKGTRADSYADRNRAHEMLDTRDDILQSMEKTFKDNGKEYLSKLLGEARDKWKNLKDTYYSHPRIAKMVDPDIRLTPKNIANTLSEDSVPMNKVLKAHPEIKEQLDLHHAKKDLIKSLKGSALKSAIVGGNLSLADWGKSGFDMLKKELS